MYSSGTVQPKVKWLHLNCMATENQLSLSWSWFPSSLSCFSLSSLQLNQMNIRMKTYYVNCPNSCSVTNICWVMLKWFHNTSATVGASNCESSNKINSTATLVAKDKCGWWAKFSVKARPQLSLSGPAATANQLLSWAHFTFSQRNYAKQRNTSSNYTKRGSL